VYPAISIADAIMKKRADAVVSFAGSPDKIEWKAVPGAGYPIHPITVQGLQRKLTAQNLVMPFKVIKGLRESVSLIQQFDADVVVGTGGYVALPVLLAARYLVRPILIQEQNAFMGLTNRVASKFASSIHLAFDEATPSKSKARVSLSGNPVRSNLADADPDEGRAFYEMEGVDHVLFVFGGSMGSQALNEAMAEALNKLLSIDGLGIIWQTGTRYFERFQQAIPTHRRLKMLKYIDRMDLAYAATDLALCRSGASTCSELMITGTPSILVPSPNVAEDHQTKNARSMEKQDASQVLPESALRADLVQRVKSLLDDPKRIERMSRAASRLARPNAADEIAEDTLNLAEMRQRQGIA